MKLNARWTSPVYPVLKDQSYGKMCKNIFKKIARQVLTYNSKNFHLLNKGLDLERTMTELRKPFLNKSDKNQE